MSIPVLIVSFSRLENVTKLIDQLHNQGVGRIYLAIDGPKTVNDFLQTQIEAVACRQAAELNIELRVWRREFNLGPAVSVITAVDWFFSNEDCGLILEDDLILSTSAIEYFDISLSLFAESQSVFLISGSNYFDQIQLSYGKIPATHYPVIWGWASWSDRWRGYRTALDQLSDREISATWQERSFWKTGLRRCLNGIKDAWDIPLGTYQQSQGYLSVLPPVNLVSNCGADQFAGNTMIDEWPLNIPLKCISDADLNRIRKEDREFDEILIRKIDSLFREKIYRISELNPLPPMISMLVDFFRYPLAKRDRDLLKRVAQVNIPSS